MSAQKVTVYQVVCDAFGCKNVMCDDEIGFLVFMDERAAKASVTNTSLVTDEDEWTAVGDLHFCWYESCQAEAKAAARELKARQPVKNLPGQMELLAEVGGVPVVYGEVTS